MSEHRATSTDTLIRTALEDFYRACDTAVELIRRGRYPRAQWALVRAGRKVALAAGVTFEDHPLGDLVYVEPHKITPADIAREKQFRVKLAAREAAS